MGPEVDSKGMLRCFGSKAERNNITANVSAQHERFRH
jgi:hypothetical protein